MSDGVFLSYDEILEHRRGVLERLHAFLSAPDGAAMDKTLEGGGWSARQTLEHLVIVGEGILTIVDKLLGRAAATGKPPAAFRVDVSAKVREYVGRKVKTRPPFEPKGRLEPAESFSRLEAITRRLERVQGHVAQVDPASVTFHHWVFGPLTLAEWIAFIGLHEERHLGQLGAGTL